MASNPLTAAPGVVSLPTSAKNSASWSEANLIRWKEGKLTPVGGWARLDLMLTASPVRRVHQWRDTTGAPWIAYLCEQHVYVEIGGALVDITPAAGMTAPAGNFIAGGFGDNKYNLDEFGTARPVNPNTRSVGYAYSMDNWGEDLVFMTSFDTKLYRWTPSVVTPGKAAVVAGAPTGRAFVVTPQRYVVMFDYNNNIGDFAWCDQEDIGNWNFADVASKAGYLPTEPRAPHITGLVVTGGILHFTTNGVHLATHIGLPYIYSTDIVSTANPPISDRAAIAVAEGAVWMAENGLWQYNGTSTAPIACPVWNWVTERVDWKVARFTANVVHLSEANELWFFFPAKGEFKNTHFIIFNYREGWWSQGRLSRSAGASGSYTSYPVMADDNVIYRHEFGTSFGGAPELPWIESFPVQMYVGTKDLTVKQLEPDVEGSAEQLRFSLVYKQQFTGDVEKQSPLRRIYAGRVDFNVSARLFRLRVEQTLPQTEPWTLGDSRIDVVSRGPKK